MSTVHAHAILAAVLDRLIPADAWPSATQGGVLQYLERRFAEDVGIWTDLLEPGLLALQAEALVRHGTSFTDLAEIRQDALLHDVEEGQMSGWPIPCQLFFATVMRLAMEGFYASPDSGGNRNGVSWEMIGYRPGPLHTGSVPDSEPGPTQTMFDDIKDQYDAVVIGAGAGGSVAAAVLAEAGLRVLVIERGRWLSDEQVGRDHLRNHRFSLYGHNTGPDLTGYPRTVLSGDDDERITLPHDGDYHNNAMTVGGGTRVYGAQAWRFHPDDFRMATRYGIPDESSLADWPLRYEDLAPYYERAEWEVGVSGDADAHPGRGTRRRPYPMPALSRTLEGQRLAQAADKLGWDVGAVPLLINSVSRDGRAACGRCGECIGFACKTNSKNGAHNTMLLRALATGRCDLLTDTMVVRIDTESGRHATGVQLVQAVADGSVRRRQVRAGHVVLAAGAIESARLLLNSASEAEPDGIGNRFGHVGRHLQGHVYAGAFGVFSEPVQDGMGPGVSVATCRFAHDLGEGIVGGGMLANEFTRLPIIHWYRALAPDAPRWGLAGKTVMRESFLRTSHVQGPIQEIPMATSRVRLSPTIKDRFGVPVAALSGHVHPESVRAANRLAQHAEVWLQAAGAHQVWRTRPGGGLSAGQHQAGTLRMGDDPANSVTDPHGRIHGYDNLWVSDGSVHVTNGGVNPVLTIYALAFRTAEHLVSSS